MPMVESAGHAWDRLNKENMNVDEIKSLLNLVYPRATIEFDEKCHQQYNLVLHENRKPQCIISCNKVKVNDNYIEIANFQFQITLEEFRKFINNI